MPKNYYNIIKLLQNCMLLQNEVKYLLKKIGIVEEEKIALSDELKNAKCLHNNQSNILKDLLSDSKKNNKYQSSR